MSTLEKRYAEWLLSKAIPNGDCLDCHFADNGRGYRRLPGGDKAHRFICDTLKGPIPSGLWALHTCDNRACINPEHLYIGTRQNNIDDMVSRGRHKAERTRMISAEQEIEIRELHANGKSYSEIGAKFGVTKQTIYKYIKGLRGDYASTPG